MAKFHANIDKTSFDNKGDGYVAIADIYSGCLLLEEKTEFIIPLETKFKFQSQNGEETSFCDFCFQIDLLKYSTQKESKNQFNFCSASCKRKFLKTNESLTKTENSLTAELKLAFLLLSKKLEISQFDSSPIPFIENEQNFNFLSSEIFQNFKSSQNDNLIDNSIDNSNEKSTEKSVKNIQKIDKNDIKSDKNSEKTILTLKNIKNDLLKCISIVNRYCFSPKIPIMDEIPYALAVFPSASFFNHSCRPNCHFYFDGKTIKVFALRELKNGEELNISYSTNVELGEVNERRGYLKEQFGFDCVCGRCLEELGVGGVKKSDCLLIEPSESLKELLTNAETNFQDGNLISAWRNYKQFFDNYNPIKNDISYIEILDKMLSLAILTKNYKNGAEIAKTAIKTLEKFPNQPKKAIKETKTVKPVKNRRKNKKNRYFNPENELEIIDIKTENEPEKSFNPLQLKFHFAEVFFLVSGIKSNDQYFELEVDIFDKAAVVKEQIDALYGGIDGLWPNLEKVHFGFASVFKILESVESYFNA